MAKRASFSFGPYELGWLNGQACAIKWEDGGEDRERTRVLLPAWKTDGLAACRAALIAFAERELDGELKTDATINKVFSAYREYLRNEGKHEVPAITVWKHLGPHFGRLTPAQISDAQCQAYALARVKEGASQGTVWTELNRLAAALNWASKKDLEPPRVCRRLQILRDWSYGESEDVPELLGRGA
jgi:hypothetical protein